MHMLIVKALFIEFSYLEDYIMQVYCIKLILNRVLWLPIVKHFSERVYKSWHFLFDPITGEELLLLIDQSKQMVA